MKKHVVGMMIGVWGMVSSLAFATPILDQSQYAIAGGTWFGSDGTNVSVAGQSFTPTLRYLTAVSYYCNGGNYMDIKLDIYGGSDAGGWTPLYTQNYTTGPVSRPVLELANPVDLGGYSQGRFILSPANPTVAQGQNVYVAGNTYAGGQAYGIIWSHDGINEDVGYAYDMFFEEWGNSVPEPVTLALLGLGGLLLRRWN